MYVVAGVTGHTGSVVASTLLDHREKVRVLVREESKGAPWAARGAEVALADLNDAAALAHAFHGARGAYLLVPPRSQSNAVLAENAKAVDAIVEAAKAVSLPHIVFLSSIGAQLPDGTGPIRAVHYAEKKLFAAGLAVTSIRAGNFYENIVGAFAAATGAGVFPSFVRADVAVPSVGTKDIGLFAARALREGPRGIDIAELTGPRDLTPKDLSAALGARLGKELTMQVVPEEAIAQTAVGLGASRDAGELFQEMYTCLNAGRLHAEGPPARTVHGDFTIEEFLRTAIA